MKQKRLPLLLCLCAFHVLCADPRLSSILEPIFTTPAPFHEEDLLEEITPRAPIAPMLEEQKAQPITEPALSAAPVETAMQAIPAPVSAPAQTVVEPSAAPEPPKYFLQEKDLLETLHHTIQEAYRPQGELEVRLSRSWTPLPLPQPGWSIQMLHGISDALASYMTVRFEVLCGPLTLGPFVAGVRCSLWQDGWVSRSESKRGQPLEAENFHTQRVDALRARGTLVPLDASFGEFELARRLPANRPLIQSDIMPKPAVRRGEIFDVVAEEGNLHISMKAMALENGLEGDVIQVRNLTSNKIIHARIAPGKKGKVSF